MTVFWFCLLGLAVVLLLYTFVRAFTRWQALDAQIKRLERDIDIHRDEASMLRWCLDGDHVCVYRDDFVNLQESPALFFPLNGSIGQTVVKKGLEGLSFDELDKMWVTLAKQRWGKQGVVHEDL
jgi:hypothetical protein